MPDQPTQQDAHQDAQQPPWPPTTPAQQQPSFPYGPPSLPPGPPGAHPGRPDEPVPIWSHAPGMARWALALAVIPCGGVTAAVGLVLGIVVLARGERDGVARSPKVAAAAVAIGSLQIVFWLVIAAVALVDEFDGPDRDADGAILERDTMSSMDLRVGDCFDDPGFDTLEVFDTVDVVPCGLAHDFEVVADLEIPGEDFPGEDVGAAEVDGCFDAFDEAVSAKPAVSALEVYYLTPTRHSWRLGDRSLVCLAGSPDAPRRGSLMR